MRIKTIEFYGRVFSSRNALVIPVCIFCHHRNWRTCCSDRRIPEQFLPSRICISKHLSRHRRRGRACHSCRGDRLRDIEKVGRSKGPRGSTPYICANRLFRRSKVQTNPHLLDSSPSHQLTPLTAAFSGHNIEHQWWRVNQFPVGSGADPDDPTVPPSTGEHQRDHSASRQRCH